MNVEITVIRSRRRTMALEITRDGLVVVRSPQFAAQREIERFVNAHQDWIAAHLRKRQQYQATHPAPTPEEIEALRRQAKAVLPEKVAYWANLMGVTPSGVKITSARTRFGSCSGKNGLCFSLYLMQYPEEAIDYVVVHELAHIRQHNHSSAFYAEVARVMPDYKRRMALLKE